MSTGRLADNGIESTFRRCDVRLVMESDALFVGAGTRDKTSGMYLLPEPQMKKSKGCLTVASTSDSNGDSELWHRRLAYINIRDLTRVHQHVSGVPKLGPMTTVCRACRLGKAHKLPFPGNFQRAAKGWGHHTFRYRWSDDTTIP